MNVLSQNRDTPNMALVDAHEDPRLVDHFDTLVRLEVASGGFTVQPADPVEAQAFWDSRLPSGPPASPRLDLTVRGPQDLRDGGLELLPVVDALTTALEQTESNPDASVESLREGFRMLCEQFANALAAKGVERIETAGQKFDPSWHEAMAVVETTECEDGAIVEELQGGYRLNDQLLRAARVTVAKAPVEGQGDRDGHSSEANGE